MLTGGGGGSVDSSIAIPQDMSGQAIYDQMRNGVPGTSSLYDAERAAKSVASRLGAAEQAMRSYQNSIAAGIQGDSGDAANNAAKPLIDSLTRSQEEITAFGGASFGQANSFDERAPELVDVPAQEPSWGTRALSSMAFWTESDPSNDIDEFNQANEKNKQLFAAYGGQTQGYAGLLPGGQAAELNSFTAVEIYNPRRAGGTGGNEDYSTFSSGDGAGGGTGTGAGGTPGGGGYAGHHTPDGSGTNRGGGPAFPGGGAVPGGAQSGGPSGWTGPGGGPGDDYPATRPIDGTSAAAYNPANPSLPGSGGAGPGSFGSTGVGTGGLGAGGTAGSPGAGSFGAGLPVAGGFGPGGGSGAPGAGQSGSGGSLGAKPGMGATAGAAEAAAGRAGRAGRAGGAGGRPGGFGGAPMGGGAGARNEEDDEHQTASYLVTDENGDEIVGDLPRSAPPVIGE